MRIECENLGRGILQRLSQRLEHVCKSRGLTPVHGGQAIKEAVPAPAGLRILPDLMLAFCEHQESVNVISAKTIKGMRLSTQTRPKNYYCGIKQPARQFGGTFNDVRLYFPDADQYKSLLIFNIRRNYYRLIVKVDYRAKLLTVKEFLTHNEYMRGGWKKWAP